MPSGLHPRGAPHSSAASLSYLRRPKGAPKHSSSHPHRQRRGFPRLLDDSIRGSHDSKTSLRELRCGDRITIPVASSGQQATVYHIDRVVGSGSFGVVFMATVEGSDVIVAIKKVLQDARFKNRELSILKLLPHHPNIMKLHLAFYTSGSSSDEVYLNLVTEYLPEHIDKLTKHFTKSRQVMNPLLIKLYSYQLFRGLAHMHSIRICHRDIKPQNLLVDPQTCRLAICDFGSAKRLSVREGSVFYICSRYYRAPELLFGSTHYSTKVDVWSAACVMAEMMIGRPLFAGETSIDQLVQVISVLGTPTHSDIQAMHPDAATTRFPQVPKQSLRSVFRSSTSDFALDFLSKILVYDPCKRLSAQEALLHPYFDELRTPGLMLPNGSPLPPLFNFTDLELKHLTLEEIRRLRPCNSAKYVKTSEEASPAPATDRRPSKVELSPSSKDKIGVARLRGRSFSSHRASPPRLASSRRSLSLSKLKLSESGRQSFSSDGQSAETKALAGADAVAEV